MSPTNVCLCPELSLIFCLIPLLPPTLPKAFWQKNYYRNPQFCYLQNMKAVCLGFVKLKVFRNCKMCWEVTPIKSGWSQMGTFCNGRACYQRVIPLKFEMSLISLISVQFLGFGCEQLTLVKSSHSVWLYNLVFIGWWPQGNLSYSKIHLDPLSTVDHPI